MTTQTKTKSTALVPVEKGGTIGGDEVEINNRAIIGRPSKLTVEVIDKLYCIIAQGHYFATACQASDIHQTTFYGWLVKGEEDIKTGKDSLFADLIYAVKKAEAEAEQKLLAVVSEKAITGKEWLPAMTILERRHPDRWGRKDRSTLVVEETKQIVITTVEVVKDYGDRKIEEKGEK